MNLLELLKKKRETDVTAILNDDEIVQKAQNVYLKNLALDTCAGFVARTVSASKFKHNDKDWYYKLNVRPNTDMTATQFWQTVIYKLITKNEVLIILSDTDDLLIADSFVRNEYAVYEDVFESVSVKGYQFNRKFQMKDVIYLDYNTKKLDRFTRGLFEDYEELHSRMLEAAKRNNQVRGGVSIEANAKLDDKMQDKIQGIVSKMFTSFKKNSIALVPLPKGFDYEEYTNTTGTSNLSVDELSKIFSHLVNTVADAIGIPTALLHGDRAELQENKEAYYDFCLVPLLKKIEDELNGKIIEPSQYSEENKVEIVGVNKPSIFGLAESVDKLISSGAFSRNEIRKELGYAEVAGLDEYVITKNLESAKGGEEE